MSEQPEAPLVTPDLTALLDLKLRAAFAMFNCHQLGTVQSFNAGKQTAEVSLNLQLTVSSIVRSYPLLVDVPVFVLGGGDRVVTVPIHSGDTCLVLFNDRDIDNWFSTGAIATPSSGRLHNLADGLALVGFRSSANPVTECSLQDVEVRNGQSRIAVGDLLLLKNSVTDLLTVLQAAAAAMTTLNSLKTGGDASSAITAFQTQLSQLLKSS